MTQDDVIVFDANKATVFYPVVHRMVYYNDGVIKTKGDANSIMFDFEDSITKDNYYGRVLFKIPLIGYAKIGTNAVIKYII